MKDQIQPPSGMIGQLAVVCAALLVGAFVISLLSNLGVPANTLNAVFICAFLSLVVVFCGKAIVPQAGNLGLIFSIEALSGFGLFGIVGWVFAFGHDGLAIMIGLAAGIVLSLLLVAPRLSGLSVHSVPNFFTVRYGSKILRRLTFCVITLVSVLFVAAQLVACGLIAAQIFGLEPLFGILFGAIFVFILALPLRISGLSKAQLIISIIVFIGGLAAGVFLLAQATGIIVPHFAYGGLLTDAVAAETVLGFTVSSAFADEGIGYFQILAFILCLAVGTAVMPHILRRAFFRNSGERSVHVLRIGLIFFVALATSLPALGGLARVEFLELFTATKNMVPLEAVPPSVLIGAEICGNAHNMVEAACAAKGYSNGIPISALSVSPDSMLLALPTLAVTSNWLLALLSLVGLSVAILASVSAVHSLALSFASRARPDEAPQIMGVVIVAVTSMAGTLAAISEAGLIHLAAWAYSLIGATLVGPLILGLWWQRTNVTGAIAGAVVGFGLTAIYIFCSHWGIDLTVGSGDEWRWFGLSSLMAGTFGIVFSVITTFLMSFIGPKPKPSQLAFLQPNEELSIAVPEVLG